MSQVLNLSKIIQRPDSCGWPPPHTKKKKTKKKCREGGKAECHDFNWMKRSYKWKETGGLETALDEENNPLSAPHYSDVQVLLKRRLSSFQLR